MRIVIAGRGSVGEADAIVLATPAHAAVEAMTRMAPTMGRIVLDYTNPLRADFSGLDHEGGRSAAERLQEAAPDARVGRDFALGLLREDGS